MTAQIGDITSEVSYRGYTIQGRIYRVAYPRNGNVHNPTTYKVWDVYGPGSPAFYDTLPTLREAKNYIDGIIGGPGR